MYCKHKTEFWSVALATQITSVDIVFYWCIFTTTATTKLNYYLCNEHNLVALKAQTKPGAFWASGVSQGSCLFCMVGNQIHEFVSEYREVTFNFPSSLEFIFLYFSVQWSGKMTGVKITWINMHCMHQALWINCMNYVFLFFHASALQNEILC